MKIIVKAKITDSKIFPVKTLTAEKEFTFPDNANVFKRVFDIQKYFSETYQTSHVEIVYVKEL